MLENWSFKNLRSTVAAATAFVTGIGCLILLILLFCPALSFADLRGGDEIWAYRDKIGSNPGKPGKQNPVASVTDSQGNTIVTGYQLLPGGSLEEIYTVKITVGGSIAWRGVHTVPGMNARAVAVAVDAEDNIYVTGVNDGSNSNIHLIRYNRDQAGTDATAEWQKTFDGGGTDKATSIAIYGDRVYITGSSRFAGNECFMVLAYERSNGALSWQIPNASTSIIGKANSVSANSSSISITGHSWNGPEIYMKTISYSTSGTSVLWETPQPPAAGFQRNDSGMFVRTDSKGHTVVSGTAFNGLNSDIRTIKFCSSSASPCEGKNAGDILWQQEYDGGSDDEPRGLQLENGVIGTDDVFITGQTTISGRSHIHTARLKSSASTPQYAWARNPVFDSGGENSDIPATIVIDPVNDAIFVVGYSNNAAGNSDFRSIKYRKSTGDELWSRTYHGSADKSDRTIGAGLDTGGNLNVVGYADETTQLDSGTASGGTKGSLSDASRTWAGNIWAGHYLMMLSGTNNKDQMRLIQSNDDTIISFPVLLPDAVASGDSYYIYDKDDYDYYVVKYDRGVLNAPTRLAATAVSDNSVNLTWQDNNPVTPKFRLERCTIGTENLVQSPCNFDNPGEITVIPVSDGATSALATGLSADLYYYFRVSAYTGTDFASATVTTHPSSIEHAVTQIISTTTPSQTFSYAGVANSDDYALTIATGPVNGHPVVSGKSLYSLSGFDYYTIKLDKGDLHKLWSQRYDGPENQGDSAMCLVVDNNDQIIVSGYSWLHNLTADKDMNSILTIKYKPNALSTPENDSDNYEWIHQYNGSGAVDDRPIAIASASDPSGNVAVVGMGVHNEAEMSNHDIYVLHYPTAGPGPEGARNPGYWAATAIDKGGNDEPTAVAIDSSGNVIITGFTMNTSRSRKDYDIYTAKFDASSGAMLWERIYDNGYGDDEANSVAVDTDGNVYVAGFATNSQGDSDFITIKYDRDGNIQWSGPKLYDGPAHGDDEAVALKIDPADNHIIVAGNRLTDQGNNDIQVLKYSPAGGIKWKKTVLREHNDEDMFDMTMDASGNVYITATTTNSSNDDPQTNKDILTVKIDWEEKLSENATLFGQSARLEKPYSIASNFEGDVFIAGIAQNSMSNADYVVLKINGETVQSPNPISYTNPTYNSVTLNWADSSRGEDGYQVARRDGACPLEAPIWDNSEIITTGPNHLPANTTTFTDPGRTSRGSYCYGVRSFNATGYSRWAVKTVVMQTPPPPSPVTAIPADTSRVTISWTPQNGGQQSGFDIWRCEDGASPPCSDYSKLSVSPAGTATSYDDTTICGGKTYRYKIAAKASGWTSDLSESAAAVSATHNNLVSDSGFEAQNPAVESWDSTVGSETIGVGFDSSTVHGGSKSLKLEAIGGQIGKTLGRKQFLTLSAGGQYQLSAWFKTSLMAGAAACDLFDGTWLSTPIQLSGINDWTRVFQTISIPATGVNVARSAMRLRCYAGTTPNGSVYIDDVQISPLYTLTATRYSETEIDLAWADSAYDESGYKIERCNDAGCSAPQAIATTAANVKSYRDQDLNPGATYWYRVRPYKSAPLSCNGGWDGDYSNIATASTTNSPPILTVSSPHTTQADLVWSDTTGTENQFQIERCSGSSCVMPPPETGFPKSVAAGVVNYSDTSVCSATTYNYRVRAVDHALGLDGGKLWQNKVKLDFGATFRANSTARVTINPLTGMDPAFKDIRFFDATASREIPYWIENPGASPANVWFKTGDNNDIYLYFGNDSATGTSSVSAVFGSGMIGFWPFTDSVAAATASDLSGSGSNGAVNSGIPGGYGIVSAGRFGNGFAMDGSTALIKVPDTTGSLFDISGSHSIEFWYQYQPSVDWARLISKPTVGGSQPWDLYGFYLDNTVNAQKASYRIVSGNGWPNNNDWGSWQTTREAAVTGPSMVPGSWYHYVGRYDYSTGKLSIFVNGVESFTTAAPPFQTPPSNEPFTIGSRGSYGGVAKGTIDEVRMYNRALSDQEIAQRYAASLQNVATPLQSSVLSDTGGYTIPGSWDGPYSTAMKIATPLPVNLTADPDFANGGTSWATAVGTATGTSFDTTVTFSGSKSLKLTATGAVLGLLQTVPVVPGAEYTLSGYLKTALTAGKIQCDMTGAGGLDSAGIISSGTSDWSYKTDTVTIPAGTTSVSLRCFGDGGPMGQAWIDMVQLVPSVPVSAFSATRKSEEQVDLTWTFPTGRDQSGFRIDRCTDSSCSISTPISAINSAVATATPGSYKYSDKNLSINSDYWYRIRAYKNEVPSCNGGKGYWETASTAITGPVNTSFNSVTNLSGTPSVTTECEDLRVTDSGGVLQKFYIENSMPFSACNTTTTKLIVKVSSIPTSGKTLNLYHGNLTANRGDDNGSNVFSFFDDFNGTAIDGSKWIADPATGFSVSGGYLHGTNTSGRLASVNTSFYGSGHNLQAKVKSTLLPAGGYYPIGFSLYDNHYRSFGLIDYPSAHHYSNSSAAWTPNLTTPPAGSSRTDNMIYSILLKSSTIITPAIFDVDKNVTYWGPGDVANSDHSSSWNITLGRRYDVSQAGQTYQADWDWIRIRRYVDNAPVAGTPGTATAGSYSLSGETTNWRFLRQFTVSNASGAVQNDYQVNVVTDTTSLATDRNKVTWSTSTDTETGFVLQRCKGDLAACSGNFVTDKTVSDLPPANSIGSQASYTDRDLQLDSPQTPVSYCYRVKAVKSGGWLTAATPGETPWSNISCMSTKLQAPPSNLTATATGTAINLSWTDNTTGENGFNLERCQDMAGDTPCTFKVGNTTSIPLPPNDDKISTSVSYIDPNLCAGTYRYRISVYKNNPDAAGTSWTLGPVYLNGDSVSTDLPPVPQNLVAARLSENQIRVTWKDMTADETGFEVWRCSGPACTDFRKLPLNAAAVGGTAATATFDDSNNIIPGTTYRYKVRAYVTGTCTVYSDFSADNSASAPNGPDYATASVTAPSGFSASPAGTTQVNLVWGDTTGTETAFSVGRCTPAPCTSPSATFPQAGGATSYNDTSACAGTSYSYQVYPTVHPNLPFANSGGQSWKSLSQLTISDFKANFITQAVITKGSMDMQDDFRDIRFFDRITMTELPHWIQSSSGTGSAATARVWFKTGANPEIDLYYGNSAATSSSSKDAVFGAGLTGYWPFEENARITGTISDVSGSANHLTMSGFNTLNTYGIVGEGRYGNTLNLDGLNDYAYKSGIFSGLPTGSALSAEAWIYSQSPTYDYNGIVSWGARGTGCISPFTNFASIAMSIGVTGYPQVPTWCNDYGPGSGLQVLPNVWTHYVFTLNGRDIKIYLNGVEQTGSLDTGKAVPNVNSRELAIGALELSGASRTFKGKIDEVRLYNRVLTPQDIAARYSAVIPSVTVGSRTATGVNGTYATTHAVTETPGNKVTSYDFENDLNGWTVWGTTITADSGVYFSGRKSAKMTALMTANSSIGFWNGPYPVAAGEKFIIKAAIKANLVSGSVALCRLDNAGNPDISGREISLSASDPALNDNNWHTFSTDVTIKNGITSASVICAIWSGTNGDGSTKSTAYFDAVQLIPVPSVTLTTTQVSETEVDLTWNDLFSDETGFNIYRCQGAACDPVSANKQLGAGIVKYRDSGLTPGQNYGYKVSAYKTATCPWESTPSDIKSVTTALTPPVLTAVTPQNSTVMKIDWSDTTSTDTGYTLERCDGESCKVDAPPPVYSIISSTIPATHLIEEHLKARYTFNGNQSDSSGQGLDLSSSATPSYDDGGIAMASMCGMYSPVTGILNTDEHTIEFEHKFTSNTGGGTIFYYRAGNSRYNPSLNANNATGTITITYDPGFNITIGSTGINGTPFAYGNWYRIRLTKSAGKLNVFVDDKQIVTNLAVPNSQVIGGAPQQLSFGSCWNPSISLRNMSIYSSGADARQVSFVDDKVCPGTYYKYRVTPNKGGGWGQSMTSNALGTTTPIFMPPQLPVTASEGGDTHINLSWNASSQNDQTGFILKECPDGSSCIYPSVANIIATSRTGLTPETRYCYSVASYKTADHCNAGAGVTSTYVDANRCITTFSARAGNLTARALGPNKILLEWDDMSENEDKFLLQKKIFNGKWVTREVVAMTTGKGTRHSFIDTVGIQPLKKYTYRVVTLKGSVESPPSNEAVVTYTDPDSGTTIETTPAFKGGIEKSTCICTTVDGKEICK